MPKKIKSRKKSKRKIKRQKKKNKRHLLSVIHGSRLWWQKLKKSVEINPDNQRFLWRARRLELYIAQRLEEYKKGLLGEKAESVRRVMEKDNYKRLVKSFQLRGRAGRAFKNFNHLITDPKQQHCFKLKNVNIKGLTEDLLKKIK